MASFIDYSQDEIETIYELLDADYSNRIRNFLTQSKPNGSGPTKKKIKFRIKPTPQTPKENHKYCTMDCYLSQLPQGFWD